MHDASPEQFPKNLLWRRRCRSRWKSSACVHLSAPTSTCVAKIEWRWLSPLCVSAPSPTLRCPCPLLRRILLSFCNPPTIQSPPPPPPPPHHRCEACKDQVVAPVLVLHVVARFGQVVHGTSKVLIIRPRCLALRVKTAMSMQLASWVWRVSTSHSGRSILSSTLRC